MSDEDKAQDNYRYYMYCREQGHDQFLRESDRAFLFYVGRHWSVEEESEMRQSGRPTLTINQFFRNLDSIVGEMIYGTGDVRFTPTDLQGGDDVSTVLDKIYLNTTKLNKVQYLEPALILEGLLTGRAYYDVRVDFDEQLQGQVTIKRKRPQNVVLNPTIESPDPDTWPEVYETTMASLNDIAFSYGDAAAKEIGDTPQSDWLSPYDQANERLLSMQMAGSLYFSDFSGLHVGDPKLLKVRRLISRQYRELRYKEHFVDVQTGDMSPIPKEWDRNKIARVLEATGMQVIKRRTKIIKWRVSCDRFLLHDDESPYQHFTIVPYFPYFVDGFPMALGSQLIDMQRMTNKLYSQVLHILNSAANSGWKVKQGSLKNMTMEELQTRGAETGLVAELDNIDDLERIQPGQLPAGHDSLAQTISSMFKEISGYTNVMQGADRADAAAKAIDTKVARGQVNLATAYNALYHTKTMLAQRVRDYVQDFYTETRLMHITHDLSGQTSPLTINQPTPEGRVLNDITVGKYDVTVVPAPSRETVMQTAFQQLYDMRKEIGVQIPDSVLIQYSALPEKSQVLEAINSNTDPQAAQRQQQQSEAMQQAEIASKQAAAQNSQAQGQLAIARAHKAIVDSQSNPNADRIALDRQRLAIEQSRDQRAADQADRKSHIDTSLELTRMQLDHQRQTQQQAQQQQSQQQAQQQRDADAARTHDREDSVAMQSMLEGQQKHQREMGKLALQSRQQQAQNAMEQAQLKQAKTGANQPAKTTPTTPRGKGA